MTPQDAGGATGVSPRQALPEALLVPGLAGVVGYAAIAQGAFYRQDALIVGAVLAILMLMGTGRSSFSGVGLVAGGFGLLGAGLVASAAANGWPTEAILPAAGLVSAAGAFAVVRGLALRGRREEVLEIVTWTAAAVGLLGFVGVAFHLDGLALEATRLRRASSTLTYANATAALLVLAAPAAVLLREPRSAPTRTLAFAILTGLAATVSRGGALAVVVLTLLAGSLGSWRALFPLGRPLIGAAIASAGLVPSIAGEGAHPVPALVGLAVGVAVAATPTRRRAGARVPNRMALGATIAVVVGAVGVVAVTSGAELGRVVGARLGAPESEGRLDNWARTFESALDDPWFGTGPGSFRGEASRAAHNEYLQTFSETGVVGLASVIGALGLFAAQLGGARWRIDRTRWAIAAAACVAFAIHSGVDFLWRFPLLLIVAFAWLALGVTDRGAEPPVEEGRANPLP